MDFVGYEQANKFFNIISPKIQFQDEIAYKISDDMRHLQNLAVRLMQQQGTNFFLNEYPEECEYHQFLDLDANISEDTLERIIISLQELSTKGEVQVLRNTVSNKVHLIMDTPVYSARHSIHNKAVANWLCKYLYDSCQESDIGAPLPKPKKQSQAS
jgi:hypothetical protein